MAEAFRAGRRVLDTRVTDASQVAARVEITKHRRNRAIRQTAATTTAAALAAAAAAKRSSIDQLALAGHEGRLAAARALALLGIPWRSFRSLAAARRASLSVARVVGLVAAAAAEAVAAAVARR